MRPLLMVLVLSLPLLACSKSNDAEENQVGPGMTAEAISANDVTAIDAVTGEAANIAADVVLDANLMNEGNASANGSAAADMPRRGPAPSGAARPTTAAPPADRPEAAPEPQSNEAQ